MTLASTKLPENPPIAGIGMAVPATIGTVVDVFVSGVGVIGVMVGGGVRNVLFIVVFDEQPP